jgi:hypothetical protein
MVDEGLPEDWGQGKHLKPCCLFRLPGLDLSDVGGLGLAFAVPETDGTRENRHSDKFCNTGTDWSCLSSIASIVR